MRARHLDHACHIRAPGALALVLQGVVLVYFAATHLVNLYPWNDLRRYSRGEQALEVGTNGGLLVGLLVLYASGRWPLKSAATALYGAFLVGQLLTWWRPYLFGASEAWKEQHRTHFARTIRLLPFRGSNPPPDAQHGVLQVLTLITLAMMVRDVAGEARR
jgi:hypothetical protein